MTRLGTTIVRSLLLAVFMPSCSHAFVFRSHTAGLNHQGKIASTTKSAALLQSRQPTRLAAMPPLDPDSIHDALETISSSLLVGEESFSGDVSYSKLSYYTVLGLYLISFPGLWSTIKRSTAAKVKRITYVSPGENAQGGKDLRQQAGEIMAYMKANNYEVVEAGETITFRGLVERSLSQAFFLTFCTGIGLISLALVLQIQFQDLVLPFFGKPNWFWIALLSPYAGLYYWRSGDRLDECTVKLQTNDEETQNEITVQGSEEELDRMWRTMEWQEKGKVRVEGLLDQLQQPQA